MMAVHPLRAPLVSLAFTVCLGAGALAQTGTPSLGALNESLQDLSERSMPAIVQIYSVAYGPLGTGRSGATVGLAERTGSGLLVSSDGYIVTNFHVVQGSRQLEVLLFQPAVTGASQQSILQPVGKRVSATLIGADAETDLAVLKVGGDGYPSLPLGDSDALRPGELVLAFGSPLGLQNSVTMGIVSAVARQLRPEDRMIYIQTDAPVNPGNSGGPLVNTQGEVVGINTLIFSQSGGSEGIGFAAPSNIVRYVFEQIRDHGRVKRGQIGVFAQTISPEIAEGLRLVNEWGVILADVYRRGPAERAGLQPGDLVVSLNGKPMENGRQFDVNLYSKPIGQPVSLVVRRGLERLTFEVTVIERSDDPTRLAALVSDESNLVGRLGVMMLAVDRELAAMLPWLERPRGLVVASFAAGTAQMSDGLQPGDVIYSLNGEEVTSLGALKAAINRLPDGAAAVFHVNRRGRLEYVAIRVN